ncbi:hypothetical protein BC936DRAFT_148490 [Jimgerdemannia flammicorona]|uniref:Sas10/Utp3/C1D family-domain-containing protein n=1 Tax=Jimgerdemannia flammicorona TaxID=994334 RepID=A0A433D2Z9_9FUNG|nr:hypothetical protein BC936DRAFT_148490 [Jimgerdemannia flammicorona]
MDCDCCNYLVWLFIYFFCFKKPFDYPLQTPLANMVPADNVDTKEIVAQDADQFIKLLQEFKSRVKEVKDQLSPTLKRVNAYELNTTKGISYLSVKHYTLLQYITNLAFFLHLKLSGKQVGGHPVVESLVELRTLLEKMKPVEQKLKYQIDKLVRAATVGPMEGEVDKGGKANGKMAKPAMAELSNSAVVAADPLAFRPNPFNLANSAAAIGNDEGQLTFPRHVLFHSFTRSIQSHHPSTPLVPRARCG